MKSPLWSFLVTHAFFLRNMLAHEHIFTHSDIHARYLQCNCAVWNAVPLTARTEPTPLNFVYIHP